LGSAEAQFKLGHLFELGEHGFPVDPRMSTYYYQLAAEQDHAEAQMALSGWYVSGGEGVPINDQLAFDWGHRAAQQGFTRAIFAMGYYYEMGVGCAPDINQANEWYARAAAAGSVEAKERLNRGNVVSNSEGTAALRRHVTQKRQKDSSSGRGRRRGGLLGRDKAKDSDKDKDSTNCIIISERLRVFVEWLEINGADFAKVEIRDGASKGGGGIYAIERIGSDERYASIPNKLVITGKVCHDTIGTSEQQQQQQLERTDDLWPCRMMLCLFLIHERFVMKEASFWKPYIDILPCEFHTPL
ncbi:hypothetical protein GGF38_005748, partial [Coemansia sp. RSA 25]